MPTAADWNVNLYLTPTSESPVTAIVYNITQTIVTDNETIENKTGRCANSVHDIKLDKSVRLAILYLTIIFGIVGGFLVLVWMACNKRLTRKVNLLSRVNTFILNLTIADLGVILLAVLPQLIWEYRDREWTAGPAMCKIVKFLQTFSITCSNYMLVVIAIDRHQAIRYPLKESIAVCCISLILIIESERQPTYLQASALDKDLDQSAHSHSLIQIVTGRLDIQRCTVSSCRQRRLWSECTDPQADSLRKHAYLTI